MFRLMLFICVVAPSLVRGITLESGMEKVQLLELYSSQGCSSCPPAQKGLNQIKDSSALWSQVVPVVFHVDYWDGLGWPDPFASAAYSVRQREFRTKGLSNSVYTPGFMLNGREWRGWFTRTALPLPAIPAPNLRAEYEQGKLSAVIEPVAPLLVLNIALLGMEMKTAVKRGENAHRILSEEFVVLDFQQVTSKTGRWQNIEVDEDFSTEQLALALWVTPQHSLEPIQATGTWLH